MSEPDDRPVDDPPAAPPAGELPIEADEGDAIEQALAVPDEGEDDYR